MLTSPDEKEVRSITPTQRTITIVGVAGSLIGGGVIGATLAGPLTATAANNSAATQLTAASANPSASAGTFKSNGTQPTRPVKARRSRPRRILASDREAGPGRSPPTRTPPTRRVRAPHVRRKRTRASARRFPNHADTDRR